MVKLSGLEYSYGCMCSRKCWLYHHKITMEQENDNVLIGRQIETDFYKGEEKHILIDDTINIDFLKNGIIYEIKKSSRKKEFAISQIKYYLYFLEQKGVHDVKGILKVPLERLQEEVVLTDQDRMEIASNINRIELMLKEENPPKEVRKDICNKCAYYELCYIE